MIGAEINMLGVAAFAVLLGAIIVELTWRVRRDGFGLLSAFQAIHILLLGLPFLSFAISAATTGDVGRFATRRLDSWFVLPTFIDGHPLIVFVVFHAILIFTFSSMSRYRPDTATQGANQTFAIDPHRFRLLAIGIGGAGVLYTVVRMAVVTDFPLLTYLQVGTEERLRDQSFEYSSNLDVPFVFRSSINRVVFRVLIPLAWLMLRSHRKKTDISTRMLEYGFLVIGLTLIVGSFKRTHFTFLLVALIILTTAYARPHARRILPALIAAGAFTVAMTFAYGANDVGGAFERALIRVFSDEAMFEWVAVENFGTTIDHLGTKPITWQTSKLLGGTDPTFSQWWKSTANGPDARGWAAIGVMGEFWVMFRWIGVILGAAIFGLAATWLDRHFRRLWTESLLQPVLAFLIAAFAFAATKGLLSQTLTGGIGVLCGLLAAILLLTNSNGMPWRRESVRRLTLRTWLFMGVFLVAVLVVGSFRDVPEANDSDFGTATAIGSLGPLTGPPLEDLVVVGDGVSMFPAFEPDILRYAVVLGEDSSSLVVTATGPAGSDVRYEGRSRPAGLTLNVPALDPNRSTLKRVRVTDENGSFREYEVVVVPADYPLQELIDSRPTNEGVALYTAAQREEGDAFIIKSDQNGVPYFWLVERPPEVPEGTARPQARLSDFKLHANGQYSYAELSSRDESGRYDFEIVILDHRFREVRRIATFGEDMNHTDHRDFQIHSNGNYVLISRNDVVDRGTSYETSVVQVIDPDTLKQIWRWNSWDHLSIEADQLEERPPEYAHVNSISEAPSGDLVLSLRWTSSIIMLDAETGRQLWTFGGLHSDFAIDDHWGGTCGPHAAQIVDGGKLIIFDDLTDCRELGDDDGRREPPLMRYVEYGLDQTARSAVLTREIIQSDVPDGPTGRVQLLPNDHVLVSWDFKTREFENHLMVEYDENDEPVRDIGFERAGRHWTSYRASLNPEPDYPTLANNRGASHVLGSGLVLGQDVDSESDGQPNASGGDDGVSFPTTLDRDQTVTFSVTASKEGYLQAWIDFNQDGDWNDPLEQILTDAEVTAGTRELTFVVPESAILGGTWVRFRLSSQQGLKPSGPAADGEVEDYRAYVQRGGG